MRPSEEFESAIRGIEGIFEVPLKLQDYFIKCLQQIESIHKIDLKNTDRTKLENLIKLLEGIRPTSLVSPVEEFNKLYIQAVVLTVSNTESILKDFFQYLLDRDLEVTIALDKKKIPWSYIKEHGYKLERSDLLEFFSKNLLSEKNRKDISRRSRY